MLSNKTQTEKKRNVSAGARIVIACAVTACRGTGHIRDNRLYAAHYIGRLCKLRSVCGIYTVYSYNVSVVFCFCSGLLLQGKQKNVRPYPLYVYYRHSAEPCV